jgi:hypothetical protein
MHAWRDCEVRSDEGNFGEVENYVPCSSAEKGCTHGETARCGVMREISVKSRMTFPVAPRKKDARTERLRGAG